MNTNQGEGGQGSAPDAHEEPGHSSSGEASAPEGSVSSLATSNAGESRSSHHPSKSLWVRIREATGTVYGDIGTSVLYTVMEITRETIRLKHEHMPPEQVEAMLASGGVGLVERADLLGGLSLIFWALIMLTIKYDFLVMRADDRGEGGDFALWSLLNGYTGKVFGITFLGYLVVTAAGLLAADGIITPPISLLGAFDPLGEVWAITITVVCLFAMFKAQWRGTSKVGGFFGWFMLLVWFPWIAIKGLPWVVAHPEVFEAINPVYGAQFLMAFPGLGAFIVLGVVVLAITGGEAKYADIGHFAVSSSDHVPEGESVKPQNSGRRPVTIAWFSLVLPCLLLNYGGQVGYMLERGVPPRANAFYALTPQSGNETIDAVILGADLVISAIAAFIASQALITGIFSITKQAIALGFMPRFEVKYTSREAEGQVYLPAINWLMFFGCLMVTLMFRNAGNLAAAYGIAVTGTMGVTTLMFGNVAYYRWRWPLALVISVCLPILCIDLTFFFSNLLKITSGGYFPVLVAAFLITIMLTWQWGRTQMGAAFYRFGVREGKKIDWLVALRDMLDDLEIALKENLPHARMLVQGRRRLVESDRAAVFLCSRPIRSHDDYVPVVLRVFLKKYGVLPSHIVFLHVNQVSQPYYSSKRRYEVIRLGHDIDSIVATYGYLEQPDVRGALRDLQANHKIDIAADRWIVEVGEEDVIIDKGLSLLQKLRIAIFRWTLRLSTPAHKYLGLVYDAAFSKEIIPVVFGPTEAKVDLPELEIEAR
ncbi:MAG: KUP/HAK/KT family potassium transporter [Pirellulaceae bacterium]|nr:KUP/HAK/KT family potassium transporter [Pirellulaceae bacterium]